MHSSQSAHFVFGSFTWFFAHLLAYLDFSMSVIPTSMTWLNFYPLSKTSCRLDWGTNKMKYEGTYSYVNNCASNIQNFEFLKLLSNQQQIKPLLTDNPQKVLHHKHHLQNLKIHFTSSGYLLASQFLEHFALWQI
jgi:hypothetical protein